MAPYIGILTLSGATYAHANHLFLKFKPNHTLSWQRSVCHASDLLMRANQSMLCRHYASLIALTDLGCWHLMVVQPLFLIIKLSSLFIVYGMQASLAVPGGAIRGVITKSCAAVSSVDKFLLFYCAIYLALHLWWMKEISPQGWSWQVCD